MQLVQKRRKVSRSTTRLLWWLGALLAVLIIIIIWYLIGSININANAKGATSAIETGVTARQ